MLINCFNGVQSWLLNYYQFNLEVTTSLSHTAQYQPNIKGRNKGWRRWSCQKNRKFRNQNNFKVELFFMNKNNTIFILGRRIILVLIQGQSLARKSNQLSGGVGRAVQSSMCLLGYRWRGTGGTAYRLTAIPVIINTVDTLRVNVLLRKGGTK